MTDRLDIVAAFADGESVAAADLDIALAHEDARAYLIDVLALRGLVSGAKPQPSIAPNSSAARRQSSPLRFRLLAAAAIIISVASGFAVGRKTTAPISSSVPMSTPANGVATPQAVTERTQPISTSAPAPTHVFRMENGVTWNERAGGN